MPVLPSEMPPGMPGASDPAALAASLEGCMLLDAYRLGRQLAGLQRRRSRAAESARELGRIARVAQASTARCDARRRDLPRPVFPDDLPVSLQRERIRQALSEHQVLIVAGETGSGKTTQLPKICLELQRGVRGMIGVTQPRRIAAISVAERVAGELQTPVGHAVGYQIRFEARLREETFVKFMTDGILLAETRRDRGLRSYDTIIIDEAHERTLNIDFLLGYVQRLIAKRPELKVVISSATLDVGRFSHFFGDAPVIEVAGRTHPVEIRYLPPEEDEPDIAHLAAEAVDSLIATHETGDILVFLATEQDIRETAETLTGRSHPGVAVLPLYGRLPATEQRRVFLPGGGRRIVLSTNVAETSVTVPGIRFVVDTGLARVRRFNPRTQVERLQIERVSRASADQRAGRCGRLGPGICVRLYSDADYRERPRFTDPEIKRSSLARVILQMESLRLGAIEAFPLMDRPLPSAVRRGRDELLELGALDGEGNLTGAGEQMARLPLEPRFSRMLLAADRLHCLAELLVIVAALDLQDPRERPHDQREAADAVHRRLLDPDSDFTAWLHLWRFVKDARGQAPSNAQFRKWCRQHFLSYRRVREWFSVRDQLAEAMAAMGCCPGNRAAVYEAVHKAILAGLLSRIGQRTEEGLYRGSQGGAWPIWPGSGLARKGPRWIMAAELVETRRLYGRCAARINPAWAEEIAPHLCKRAYLDPHWDGKSGLARAYEQVTLFGLPIIERRRVHLGPVDPVASRRLLIRDGIIKGDLRTRLDWFHHNQELAAEVMSLEHKGRQHGLVVDPAYLFAFYDEKIPPDVVTLRQLERWSARAEARAPGLLHMRREELLLLSPDGLTPDRFPAEMRIGNLCLPLSYRFAPGEEDDGITCTLPVAALPQLDSWRFEWLVPGLLGEKVALLLRSLPRSLRKHFVPIPESVERLIGLLRAGEEPLTMAMAKACRRMTSAAIAAASFRPETLPTFLQMRFVILGEGGQAIASGRDIEALRSRFHEDAAEQFAAAPKRHLERQGILAWDFGDLPEAVTLAGAGAGPCLGYPALQDDGESAAIRVLASAPEASWLHRRGTRRLIWLALGSQTRNIARSLPISHQADLCYAALGGSAAGLRRDLLLNAIDHVFLSGRPPVRTADAFQERIESGRSDLYAASHQLGEAADAILRRSQALGQRLLDFAKPVYAPALADLRDQLAHLVSIGFLMHVEFAAISNIPRYLEAMALRLDRLAHAPGKDRRRMEEVARFWRRYLDLEHRGPAPLQSNPEVVRFRWLVEEYRVSVFAQELGTAQTASAKRLDAQWLRVESLLREA